MTQNWKWAALLSTSVNSVVDLRIFIRKLPPSRLIFYHFTLEQIIQAYGSFDHEMKVEALKVIVTNEIMMEKSLQTGRMKAIPFPLAACADAFLDDTARNPFKLKGDKSYVADR
jgi:hypothetical protein